MLWDPSIPSKDEPTHGRASAGGFRSFGETAPSHWFTYLDDTWVKIRTQVVEPFSEHVNIKFTCQDVEGSSSVFLDCVVQVSRDADTYREPAHTDQYLLEDSHQLLEHKLGVIPPITIGLTVILHERREKERKHLEEALKTCGFPNCVSVEDKQGQRGQQQPTGERQHTVQCLRKHKTSSNPATHQDKLCSHQAPNSRTQSGQCGLRQPEQ